MYRQRLNTLRVKIGRATSKHDGFLCAKYFTGKIDPDQDFWNDLQRRNIPKLTRKLDAASRGLGGNGVSQAKMLCIDDAHFRFFRRKVDGRIFMLLYFEDLLKGLIYIATGETTFEVYYFSFARAWRA